jgi:pSer/pThr/pTyr-binding forkhead associated (FHA) protein
MKKKREYEERALKNYYAILEVPDGSSAEEIDQSYQRLALHYQDDAEALAGLKEAHDALTNAAAPVKMPPAAKIRRCPVGADAQCPVLLKQVAAGDNFCPECGYLLAGIEAGISFEPLAVPEENEQIRLEEPDGRIHLLPPGTTIVGRENADILLADKTVSRQHARLEVTADGLVMLEDLNSTNGTQVAGDRLLPHVPRQLFSGDRIRFGSFATELHLPEVRPPGLPMEAGEEAPLPAETALAHLVEIRDGGGRIVPLPAGVTTFGRRADNTVVLPGDPYVSGSHAQILAAGDVFRLTDVGSTNGTLLNGERLAINAPMFLNPGDVILIGSTALRFELVAAPEQNTEEAAPTAHQNDVPEADAPVQEL